MRKSVKLFSILLALAVVISVVPVAGALADGVEVADTPEATAATEATTEPEATETAAPADSNGFAPQNLRWEGTTLLWDPPYPMPTAKDMGLDSRETQYLLNYEVSLHKTDSYSEPEIPFRMSYAPVGAGGTITDDTFVNDLTDGGTFYFTVQLVAIPVVPNGGSRKPLWSGALATSGPATFEKVEKTPLEKPEIDVDNTFISTRSDFNPATWDFDEIELLEVTLKAESECEKCLYVLTWYGTNDEPATTDSSWTKITSAGQLGLSFSIPTARAEGYKHLAFTIQFYCMDGKHTEGPESDKVLLDSIQKKNRRRST